MTTIIWVFWKLTFGYRVRATTGEKHSHGRLNKHDVVDDGGGREHCQMCTWTSEHHPPWSLREWALLVACVALTLVDLWAGYQGLVLV